MPKFPCMAKTKQYLYASLVLGCILFGLWVKLPTSPARGDDVGAGDVETPHVIIGLVIDQQGQPVFEADVAIYADDAAEALVETTTQEDGYFMVDLVRGTPEHSLRIEITRAHYTPFIYNASANEVISLRAGKAIRLTDIELERRITLGFWVATLGFVGFLLLMAFEKLHNTTATLLGAALILGVSYIGGALYPDAYIISFEEAIKHIDFDVIFLVMSMMIMVGILEATGIFQWMAFMAYRLSRGHAFVLVVIMIIITAVASALMDNVTTMLLMTPISLQIALALGIDPLALVIPEVLASNIGGISTLIGTPTNIMIGSYADIGFNDFLANLTVGVVLALVVLVFYVRWYYRTEYRKIGGGISNTLYTKLQENARITSPATLRKGLVVFGITLLFFVFGDAFHLEPAVTALIGATAFLVWVETDVEKMLQRVDWTTLVFFMALFITVGAIQEVGLISYIADFLADITNGQPIIGLIVLVWSSSFISTAIANIPFTAAMLPVIAFLSINLDPENTKYLFYGLSVGAAMGGNGSLIGASANVVTAGILERAGYKISYAKFMRVGMPAMIVTVATGTLWLLIRFFVFAG